MFQSSFMRRIYSFLLVGLFCLSVPVNGQAGVELTGQEQAWLAENSEIRVASEMDWPPFDFVDDKDQASGFSIAYFQLVANKVGLTINWVNGYSWQQLLELGQQREIDAFPAIIQNEEREQFLSFTPVYVENVVGYFMRDDASAVLIHRVEELAQYRLALVKGFDNHRRILKLLPDVDHVEVNSVLEGLKAVMTGEADLLIADTAVGNYLIKKNLLRGVQVAGGVKLPELFETAKIRIAARNDQPELISILKKGMADVTEQEVQALRNRWLDLPPQALLTRQRMIVLAVFVVLLVLLSAVSSIWGLRRQRSRLRQEMQEQTRALNESERRLALALQGGGMAAWDVDLRTGAMVLSQGWWQMAGIFEDKSSSTRQQWLASIHPEDRIKVLEAESACRQGMMNRYELEYRIRGDDGKRRWHLANAASVTPDIGSAPARMVGVIQDITERKRLDRMKDEFISSVSHELRTPLTSIKGSLGLLVGGAVGDVPDKAQNMLNIAADNCDRLLNLINDLLDMDKIQAGKLELHQEALQLSSLINKALSINQGYADKFKVKLTCRQELLPELEFHCDEYRLLQVLSNLLSNAIKFSPEGDVVTLAAAVEETMLRISISDNGPGIPKAFQEQIFKPFSQADSSDTRQRGGTGLGLVISKRLVEMHGGSIGFESRPDEGATFYVLLPLV